MDYNQERSYLLKNPPKPVTGWVERVYNFGNKTVTQGRKYKVLNYFRYLRTYGCKGEKYPQWEEFIIIKNDADWTVKMNLRGFTPCDAPVTKIQELENRILKLESELLKSP